MLALLLWTCWYFTYFGKSNSWWSVKKQSCALKLSPALNLVVRAMTVYKNQTSNETGWTVLIQVACQQALHFKWRESARVSREAARGGGKGELSFLSLDYEQSLFFLGPTSKTPETRKWPRAWLKFPTSRTWVSFRARLSSDFSRLPQVESFLIGYARPGVHQIWWAPGKTDS